MRTSLVVAAVAPVHIVWSGPTTPALPAGQAEPAARSPQPRQVRSPEGTHSKLSLAPIWTATLPAPPSASPAYDDDHAYVPLRGGRLVAVSLFDGAIRWSVDRLVTIPPSAGEGMVFVAVEGTIAALAAKTGGVAWQVSSGAGPPALLLFDGGWLIAGTGGGEVLALRARDGTTVWQRTAGAPVVGLPALVGDRLFLSLQDGRVAALELRTGQPVWERRLGGPPGSILGLSDRLFVGSDDKYFYCLDARNGNVKWRWRTGAHVTGTPAVDEEHVYFLSLDNQLRALDRDNGSQAWRASLPRRALAGPLRMGDLLLVSGISAEVRAYRPKDGTAAGEVTAADELVAPPHLMAGASGIVVLTGSGYLQLLAPPAPKPPQWLPWVWWD